MYKGGCEEPLDWMFSQVFGERKTVDEVQEVDIISAIEFDRTGDHLATGDRGGQVVLFERTDVCKAHGKRKVLEKMDHPTKSRPEFRYRTQFQSHEPEFDYLKSFEIQEKINKIRWCETTNNAQFLLSTNDKTIKLWKIHEKKNKNVCEMNLDPLNSMASGTFTNSLACASNGSSSDDPSSSNSFGPNELHYLQLPKITSDDTSPFTKCRRIYSNAHDYHINSISNNSDGETFISADDLRINLWNLEINSQSFTIVDLKPENMDDLAEVITSAEFHPTHCNMLGYSSSKGLVRLIDLRQSALCDSHSKLFVVPEAPAGSRSFLTEILATVSDFKFAKDGRHMLSRDYMTLKLWDINMDSGPVATFQVHEHIRPKLCDLYENDLIFDKFECCFSGDSQRVASGSYSNQFTVFGCAEGSTESNTLEASEYPKRIQSSTASRPSGSLPSSSDRQGTVGITPDFNSKLLHLAWHPKENLIACAASSSLYIYYA